MRNVSKLILLFLVCITYNSILAQTDTASTQDEEDYSIYDNLEFADESAKRFASIKLTGKSPDKLISIGYDYQGGYDLNAGAFSIYPEEEARVTATHGTRVEANIPVISKNSIIIQAGLSYWDVNYDFKDKATLLNPLNQRLADKGLNTINFSTTVYKPLNETTFIIGQVSVGISGDYAMDELQSSKYNRYSGAILWGKRPSDYMQWAIGLSRSYRAGELNYFPLLMYNWTSYDRKWGIESLLPARGDVRYSFNPRSLLFFGFDLEGTSYRIGNDGKALDAPYNDLEIRRCELRFRFKYEKQLSGFIWVSAKVGYRYDYLFYVDQVNNGEEFFRGFFGDQEYAMENKLTNPLFFNFSINLVSP